MTKTLLAATLAAAFALTTFQSEASARGGRHHAPSFKSTFSANGGNGGSYNTGNRSGNGGNGGKIENAGKAKAGTNASANGGNGGNYNSGNRSGNGGRGGSISF